MEEQARLLAAQSPPGYPGSKRSKRSSAQPMTVFLIDLEAVESRYTGQWKTHIPRLLKKHGHLVHVSLGV